MGVRWKSLQTYATCFVGTAFVVMPVYAEPSDSRIGLGDVIALAVRNNPMLQAAGAEVAAAEAQVYAAKGLDDFMLEAEANASAGGGQLFPGSTLQPISALGGHGALSLIRPLPSGGRLGLHFTGDYGRAVFDTGNDRVGFPVYGLSMQASLEHPLLRGAGQAVARADRRRAHADSDISHVHRAAVATTLLKDVVTNYWDYVYATSELAIRRRAAESAHEHLLRVQANIDVGKQPTSAVAEIEVAIALREDASLVAGQALANRVAELSRLCGVRLDAALQPQSTLEPPTRAPDRAVERARVDNPQLQVARAETQASKIELDVTENGMLPSLDVLLAAGPSVSVRDLERVTTQLKQLRGYAVSGGLTLTVPLERRQARGLWAAARAHTLEARLRETDLSRQVETSVVQSVGTFQTARERSRMLSRSMEAATLDLASVQALFETGRATNYDVLRRQDTLVQVEIVHQRAVVEQLKALAMVDALTGQLLAQSRVHIR